MNEENLQQQWILEFLLRQEVEDSIISRLISSFSSITGNHRIMTRLLLKRASSIIQKNHTLQQSDDLVMKRVLETLEMILAINQVNPRFMNLMEKAKSEVERAVNDVSGCVDTRKLAFRSVSKILTEATQELGRSYLETVVKTMCEEVRDNEVAVTLGDNPAEVGREGAGDLLDDNNINRTDVGCFEHDPCVTTKSNSVLAGKEICQEMAPSILKPVNEKCDATGENLEGTNGKNLEGNDNSDLLRKKSYEVTTPEFTGENLEGTNGKNLEGNDNSDLLRKKSYGVTTPEFQKVKEALKSSILDLKAVVKDPLPDALRMAANVSANLATGGVSNERLTENENEANVSANLATEGGVSNQRLAEIENEVDMDMEDHYANVNVQAKDVNIRPSLMERNNTARTFEWEDEVESSRGSSERPHLPPLPPRRKISSPLRKNVRTNIMGRRRSKRWSALEEEVLRDAVKEYGRGKWQLILDNYGEIFEERTAVDLKDKWRNMTR